VRFHAINKGLGVPLGVLPPKANTVRHVRCTNGLSPSLPNHPKTSRPWPTFLTALPDSDRADIIAGLPLDKRLAVAKLIAARIIANNDHR